MQKLWGSRFDAHTDVLIERLNNSLSFDSRLWAEDIEGSIAHAQMLGAVGIISAADAKAITGGLKKLEIDIRSGACLLPEDAEDVHTAIEGLLRERIGTVAGKLHTARSRNDQIATDIRLYLRSAIKTIDSELSALQSTLLDIANREMETILPGFTHLQHAQPIVLAHHLLAYFWMIDRDRERLVDTHFRVNRLPLGACALAGTGFPIDRAMVACSLKFSDILENSLDAVGDRDFAIEFLSACSIIMMHLSRFAEEIILWNSPEFRYVELDDTVTTGSSIMPQKKNPDVAELVRGKTGRVYGALTTLLVLMKGLPLAYNKDMQEDKEPIFDAIDTLYMVIPALQKTLYTAKFNRKRMREAASGDFSTATDLADLLVRKGLPFREAHEIVGKVVRHCEVAGISLEDLSQESLPGLSQYLAENPQEVLSVVRVEYSVGARTSRGGTSPAAVREQWNKATARHKIAADFSRAHG